MVKRILFSIIMTVLALPAFSAVITRGDNGLYGLTVVEKGQTKWVVKPKYVNMYQNSGDTFYVFGSNNKWGLISGNGDEIVPCKYSKLNQVTEIYNHSYNPTDINQYANFTLTRDYTDYIRNYVEKKVNAWQKKNEFEKTNEYKERVNEANRKKMIEQALAEVCEECLLKVKDKKLSMTLLDYDADHETYLVDTPIGQFVVPVSIQNAPVFKRYWPEMTTENTYDLVDGRIVLRGVVFNHNNKVMATYSDRDKALYSQANVQFNFDPVEIPQSGSLPMNTPQINQFDISVGKSDVDIDIPMTADKNPNTFALVIANERYKSTVDVKYAHNDGKVFNEYLTKTLGVPSSNIRLIEDATISEMRSAIDWLKDVGGAFHGDIKLIVYYTGHGFPDEVTTEPYLVPSDGSHLNNKTLYPLKEFYNDIASVQAENAIIFLDACFSGSAHGDGMIAMAKSVQRKHADTYPTGNLVVFSASKAGETAWTYDNKNHGMFTYYLLKKLKDTKGNVNLGNLSDYVIEKVSQSSIVVNKKSQTPGVDPSPELDIDWKQIRLK